MTSELLPKLPNTGIFSIDMHLNKNVVSSSQSCTWQWRDDRNSWQSYLWVDNRIIEAAYQGGEDEISLSTQGRNYIIDFSNMQQVIFLLVTMLIFEYMNLFIMKKAFLLAKQKKGVFRTLINIYYEDSL